MKLITAIFRPYMFDEVRDALEDIDIHRMTTDDVSGYGRGGGHTETVRGVAHRIASSPKRRVHIVVADEDVDAAVAAIVESASSHAQGDGKVWVTPVERFVDIGTGKAGSAALT